MIERGIWSEIGTGVKYPGPKFGDVVKCKKYEILKEGKWYILIVGFNGYFREDHFAPVISDDQLEEMLNDIDELIIKTHGTW